MATAATSPIRSETARALQAAARRHHLGQVLVFGSFARGQARPDSDVDLLVDPAPEVSQVEISAFHAEAEAILGRKVDVVTRNTLEPVRHRKILEQARPFEALPDTDTHQEGTTDQERLHDVLRAIADLRMVLDGVSREAYLGQREKQLATERALAILGEAVYKLSPVFKAAHPELPAAQITALRHVLVHGYAQIDQERVWDILQNHLEPLEREVRKVVVQIPMPPGMDR